MAVMWKKNPTTEFLELFRCPKNISSQERSGTWYQHYGFGYF